MEQQDLVRLNLEIAADDASSGELDELARRLLAELRETDVESAELVSAGPAPAGAKSAEAVTAGAIALSVLPAALPKLIDFVQSWAMRGQGRRVKFKGKIGGQDVEFEGYPEDLQDLVKSLQKSRRK